MSALCTRYFGSTSGYSWRDRKELYLQVETTALYTKGMAMGKDKDLKITRESSHSTSINGERAYGGFEIRGHMVK